MIKYIINGKSKQIAGYQFVSILKKKIGVIKLNADQLKKNKKVGNKN